MFRVVLFAVLLVYASAASSYCSGDDHACTANTDCTSGYLGICCNQICVQSGTKKVANGGECNFCNLCNDGLFCRLNSSNTDGYCEPAPTSAYIKKGEYDCSCASNEECLFGVCEGSKCLPKGFLHAPCTADSQCVSQAGFLGNPYLKCKSGKCDIDEANVCATMADMGAACGWADAGKGLPKSCQMNSTGGLECVVPENNTVCGSNYKCGIGQVCNSFVTGECVDFGSGAVDAKCQSVYGMNCQNQLFCDAVGGKCTATSATDCGATCSTQMGQCGCKSADHKGGCVFHSDCGAKITALKTCATTNLCDMTVLGVSIALLGQNHGDCLFDKCATELAASYCCMACSHPIESPTNLMHTVSGINCQVNPPTFTKPTVCDVYGTGKDQFASQLLTMYCTAPPTTTTTKSSASTRITFF